MIDPLFPVEPNEIVLRPEQEDMVNQLRDTFRKHKRVILMAGTGLGKTVLATSMIKTAVSKKKRCLFVCDRRVLVSQTSSMFDYYGLDHGVIMAQNDRFDVGKLAQVGSVDTMNRRSGWYKIINGYDFIVVDEAHTIEKGHIKILNKNPNAYVLGLTATPFRKGLGKIFETHIEPYPLNKLMDMGVLCGMTAWGPETYDLSKVRTVAGEYLGSDLSKAVDQTHLVADVVKTYKKLCIGRNKTICFVHDVPHGKHLAAQFNKSGIKAAQVNSYQQEEERRFNMDWFINGDAKVICSVEILIKGFDFRAVDCVVWATATKSPTKWIQGTGRGLRTYPGKEDCLIIDHGGNFARIGFPQDFEFYELDDGKKKEQDSKQKQKEKLDKLPKVCPSCSFIKPIGVVKCPACGLVPEFRRDIETIDGELVKIERGIKPKFSMPVKKEWYAGFLTYAKEQGFKRGWAFHKYKEKFGVEPKGMKQIQPGPLTPEILGFIKHAQIRWYNSKQNPKNRELSI